MKIIVLSGSPSALPTLNYLFDFDHLSALICPANSVGTDIAPLEEWAAHKGVPCWQIEQRTIQKELSELIEETTPDLILLYGFPYTIPPQILKNVKHGGWNVHFSIQSLQKVSITIHQLVEGLGGQVLHQCEMSLLPTEEAGSPMVQLSRLSVALLKSSLRNIQRPDAGNLPSILDRYSLS